MRGDTSYGLFIPFFLLLSFSFFFSFFFVFFFFFFFPFRVSGQGRPEMHRRPCLVCGCRCGYGSGGRCGLDPRPSTSLIAIVVPSRGGREGRKWMERGGSSQRIDKKLLSRMAEPSFLDLFWSSVFSWSTQTTLYSPNSRLSWHRQDGEAELW